MSASAASAAPLKKPAPSAEEKREERARPSLQGFAVIVAQLLVFIAVSWSVKRTFFPLGCAAAAGFAIHYWTPYRFKEHCWLAIALVGGAYVAAPQAPLATGAIVVAAALVAGLVIYGIVASPLPYVARVLLVVALFAAILWAGSSARDLLHGPPRLYDVFGGIFMLRTVPYLYDARHFKARPSLREFVRYFFMLPGFILNQPLIDFQKLGGTLYPREAQKIAQQGVFWMARGFVHYLVFIELERHLHYAHFAWTDRSPRLVAVHLLAAYGCYLRTSAQIHMYLGVMHLFGFDLPEAYRWFWFSNSPIDFWRRANIYWKDAMVKVVYFPVYFSLRKKSDPAAKIVALCCVFAASWALHIWQLAWWSDLKVSLWRAAVTSPQQALMWGLFATVCSANLAVEMIAEARPKPPAPRLLPRASAPEAGLAALVTRLRAYLTERVGAPRGMHPARAALQIAGTWIFMASLLSLVRAPSISEWLYTLKFWN